MYERAMLFTWNPDRWDWGSDYDAAIERTVAGGVVHDRWSTGGRTSGVYPGDRVFLLRQGNRGRGIVASGRLISEIEQGPHWDGSGRLANYAEVEWEVVVGPEDALATQILETRLPGQHWRPQGSGVLVKPDLVNALERLWAVHTAN